MGIASWRAGSGADGGGGGKARSANTNVFGGKEHRLGAGAGAGAGAGGRLQVVSSMGNQSARCHRSESTGHGRTRILAICWRHVEARKDKRGYKLRDDLCLRLHPRRRRDR